MSMSPDFNEGVTSLVSKMSVGDIPHAAGAQWTSRLTRIADKIEPYQGKRRIVTRTDRHLPTVKRGIRAGRKQLAESTRTAAIHPPITEDLLRSMNGEWVTGPQPIRKSQIPGVGYFRAMDIPKGELKWLAHGGRKAKATREKEKAQAHFADYADQQRGVRELHRMLASKPKGTKKVDVGRGQEASAHRMGTIRMAVITGDPATDAFAAHLGGRKGVRYMVVRPGADIHTVEHELAHLTPKRSSYRLYQNINESKRLAREEARADIAASHPGGYYGNRDAVAQSGYIQAARSEGARARIQGTQSGVGHELFSPEGMENFRATQDKIHAARGGKTPPRSASFGKQPRDEWGRWKSYTVGGGVVGTTAGVGIYVHRQKKHQVAKSLTMWEGITSEVSKMNPDPADVHIVGSSGKKRGIIRKVPAPTRGM